MNLTTLPDGAIDINRRPWTLTGLCISDLWKGIGWFQNSLEELAYISGIETNFIDGEDVYKYYQPELMELLTLKSEKYFV